MNTPAPWGRVAREAWPEPVRGDPPFLDDSGWPSNAAAWCLIGLYVTACAAVGVGFAWVASKVIEGRTSG